MRRARDRELVLLDENGKTDRTTTTSTTTSTTGRDTVRAVNNTYRTGVFWVYTGRRARRVCVGTSCINGGNDGVERNAIERAVVVASDVVSTRCRRRRRRRCRKDCVHSSTRILLDGDRFAVLERGFFGDFVALGLSRDNFLQHSAVSTSSARTSGAVAITRYRLSVDVFANAYTNVAKISEKKSTRWRPRASRGLGFSRVDDDDY